MLADNGAATPTRAELQQARKAASDEEAPLLAEGDLAPLGYLITRP